ncbi:hypothetical protein BH11PLA1_BH11PLA1_11670 [soil metagenome]
MTAKHVGHGSSDIAFHVEWGFRREALIWLNDRPVAVNFAPLATEFYAWLLRKGQIRVLTEEHKGEPVAYTNPYTYTASTIGVVTAAVINDSHTIATSSQSMDALEAEVARSRSYAEQVLYTARLCESLIKQLLFCTQIPNREYERASLGGLLSVECRGCKGSGRQRHKISLLGSLAHRYGLCHEFEGCLVEHLKLVGRRRNTEAAHSDIPLLNVRNSAASRAQLNAESLEIGNELVHMLRHLSDLESRMGEELQEQLLASSQAAFNRMLNQVVRRSKNPFPDSPQTGPASG